MSEGKHQADGLRRVVVLAGDSLFAYLLAQETFARHHARIDVVVVSERIRSSRKNIWRIIKRSSKRYVAYRIAVEMITRLNRRRGRRTVVSLAQRYEIPVIATNNVNRPGALGPYAGAELALTFNFDQVLEQRFIDEFGWGVINVHASRLPEDKGISPVLWAFARGDSQLWSSIYKMDGGLDSGPLIEQFPIDVEPGDTSFAIYERVCRESGVRLVRVVSDILAGLAVDCTPQPEAPDTSYWSWPDDQYDAMLKTSRRSHLGFGDLLRAIL